jgi:hypothetical protein
MFLTARKCPKDQGPLKQILGSALAVAANHKTTCRSCRWWMRRFRETAQAGPPQTLTKWHLGSNGNCGNALRLS